MKIFIGNLSFHTTEETLRVAFENYGVVDSVTIAVDRETNRSRGFGFVVMPVDAEATSAILGLRETELDGRVIHVNEARSDAVRSDRTSQGRFGSRGPRRYGD